MEKRPFGWTKEELPVIGLGTWHMEEDDRAGAVAAIHRALDRGMTHIDTAEMYGSGRVEELVGEAIADRRDQVFLTTKVLPNNASYDGTMRACERSLQRLGTDRIDLYLLHWPGPHQLAETIGAFEKLVGDGKIRYYGVSNFDTPDLQRAVSYAGEHRIACNQVCYHLGERYIERFVIPACERHDIAVVGYSPFGSSPEAFPAPESPGGQVLQRIGDALGLTPRQAALRFLVRHPHSFSIPKSAQADHVEELAQAGRLRLTDREIDIIDEAFPWQRQRGGLPTI